MARLTAGSFSPDAKTLGGKPRHDHLVSATVADCLILPLALGCSR
jgi:hypothetical protein